MEETKIVILFKTFIVFSITLSSVLIPNFADIIEIALNARIDAFQPPSNLSNSNLHAILEGFTKWDAQYFLFIANYGYISESNFAFFPLWPLALKLSSLFLPSFDSLIVIWGLVLNLILVVFTCKHLTNYSIRFFPELKDSHVIVFVFLANPAGIFFHVLYSESLYLFFVLFGTIMLMENNLALASLVFHLASWTRANGIVNGGYFLFLMLMEYILWFTRYSCFHKAFLKSTFFFALFALSVCPFFFFQLYAYHNFCFSTIAFSQIDEKLCGYLKQSQTIQQRLWCNSSFPLVYSYVQDKYWNNGFLSYYTFQNIPNFIFAIPVLLFVPMVLRFSKDIKDFNIVNLFHAMAKLSHVDAIKIASLIQLLVLYLFALLFMNIQVTTRFIFSSCPIVYPILAKILYDDMKATRFNLNKFGFLRDVFSSKFSELPQRSQLLVIWCISYNVLGIILHPNRLPWT
ncbi:GPI alpha-1,6-mannosyltransferase 2-like [Convolutriloba macropyga]|uniref:GPI alpha-1,6-mannosyltransferase 2-like n=1 Tax=Convolutriloba macropyga TaxID=536237 RepID=UPI003F51E8A2